MQNESDIAFDFLENIYRPAWRKANPDADKRISPSPASEEWIAIAKKQLEFWSIMADSTSILHQYLSEDIDSEGITICPECRQNISGIDSGHGKDAELIEKNQCPLCDCSGIAEYEYEYQDKCQQCSRLRECEREEADAAAYAEERTRELIRYQCRGSGEWPPSGIGEYNRMYMGR